MAADGITAEADALEEQVLEQQVSSLMSRIFGPDKRNHEDIERDIRRDNFELGKVLRARKIATAKKGVAGDERGGGEAQHQAADRGEAPPRVSPNTIVYLSHLRCSTEFADTTPSARSYSTLYGLRCLVRASREASSAPAGEAAVHSSLRTWTLWPTLESTRSAAKAVLRSGDRGGFGQHSLVDEKDASDRMLSAAHDLLALAEDLHGADCPLVLRWARSLHHHAHANTFTHHFLPPLPPPGIQMDKYVALVVSLLGSLEYEVPMSAAESAVLRNGLSRQAAPQASRGKHTAADRDSGILPLWPTQNNEDDVERLFPHANATNPVGRSHAIVLVEGKFFKLDVRRDAAVAAFPGAESAAMVAAPLPRIFPLAEFIRLVYQIFVLAASTPATQTPASSTALLSDTLVGLKPHEWANAKEAYSHIRCEAREISAHEPLLEALETAQFVLCYDATVDRQALLAHHEVIDGEAAAARSTASGPPQSCSSGTKTLRDYPHRNRWLVNCLNVAIDRLGQIEIIMPTALSQSCVDGESLSQRIGAYLARKLRLFDELASEDFGLPGRIACSVSRCVWATGLIFKLLTQIPGKVTVCLLVEQLEPYAHELQKYLPDAEEREAMRVASEYFARMTRPEADGNGHVSAAVHLLRTFLRECQPFYQIVAHPTIDSPQTVPPVDREHSRLVTMCILNPFVASITRRSTIVAAPSAVDVHEAQSAIVPGVDPVILEVIARTPPGQFKNSALEKLDAFQLPTLCSGAVEYLNLFSTLPSKEQRRSLLLAAGAKGFHVRYRSEAVAAVEDAAKREYYRLLYTHALLLQQSDPWKSLCLSTVETEEGTLGSNVVTVSSEVLFSLSRRISRFLLRDKPYLEDEALAVRFAHPDAVMRALASLCAQLAVEHIFLPLEVNDDTDMTNLVVNDRSTVGECRLVAGELVPWEDALGLYRTFFFHRLCGTAKGAEASTQQAARVTAYGMLRLLQHHYEPVQESHHIRWVGTVQRPCATSRSGGGVEASYRAVDVPEFAQKLAEAHIATRNKQGCKSMGWSTHLDLLDCASRCGPAEGPCTLSLANGTPLAAVIRAPLVSLAFQATEVLELQTGDKKSVAYQRIRNQRSHWVEPPVALSATAETRRCAAYTSLQVHLIRTKSTRYIDQSMQENITLDLRGVWASAPVAIGFRDAFVRIWDEMMWLWKDDV